MSDETVRTSGGTYSPAIVEASAYQRWIFDALSPAVGSSLLEVGVGSAPFLAWYESLSSWHPADVDRDAVTRAVELCCQRHSDTKTSGIVGDAGDPHFWTEVPMGIDSVIAVNVLEHIRDDASFLRGAYGALRFAEGRIGLFVPALPVLYGTMDEAAGHYRRYTKRGLHRMLTDAHFTVIDIRYMNFAGMFYWWWKGNVKKVRQLDDPELNTSIRNIDTYALPVIRTLERIIHPPVGQSLVAIAQAKTATHP